MALVGLCALDGLCAPLTLCDGGRGGLVLAEAYHRLGTPGVLRAPLVLCERDSGGPRPGRGTPLAWCLRRSS